MRKFHCPNCGHDQESDVKELYCAVCGDNLVELKEVKPEPDEAEVPVNNTDQTEDEDYTDELITIKGIGKKTAADIIEVYPTKSALITAINSGDELPFRDDVAKILTSAFIGE